MNTLNFRSTDDNGLSFELLIDEEPLGELICVQDLAIPYWIFEDDLPYYPPHSTERESDIRIITVCSCGEYDCGHAQCRIVRNGNNVVFCDFDFDVTAEGSTKVFQFSAVNYDNVIKEIIRQVNECKGLELLDASSSVQSAWYRSKVLYLLRSAHLLHIFSGKKTNLKRVRKRKGGLSLIKKAAKKM
jgi:hypothetical protein